MKQAYEQYLSDYGYDYLKIEVLPECKRVTRLGKTVEYQKARRRKLFRTVTYWVPKANIVWFDAPTEEQYACNCGGGKDE